MNSKKYNITGSLAAVVIFGGMLGSGIATAQRNGGVPGAEVMTRGPVHEAFAGTVTYDPVAGIIIEQSPPSLIEEVPPDQRPVGDNVAWIPGYWAWDEDQNDFLWISGIWRNLPPGREWVPGYWAETGNRYQWTSGYWENAETTEVSYLPEPPRSVETGPNIVAVSNDQTWVPGNWVYRQDRYAWRAGYWVTARANWSWTPAYYRWTHRGYVYVDGYWDYPVVNRGVVFAPVRFDRSYVVAPDFYYSPVTVIALSVFTNHLFLRPTHGHYYFGDYYEPAYRDRGFYASFSYNSGGRGYDPIYAHYRWENRNDRNWDRQRQDYYEYRRDHSDARPPRTWAALNARSLSDRNRGDFGVADRYDQVVKNGGGGRQRFQAVDEKERGRFVSQRQEIRKFGKERQQIETTGDRPNRDQASRVKINRSPVMSGRSEKNGGAPARLQDRTNEKAKPDKAANTSPAKPRETAQRSSESRSKADTETRTKPGQKRKADDVPRKKAVAGESTPRKTDTMRKADPSPDRKATPALKRKAEPQTERKALPAPQRKVAPQPEAKRRSYPTPTPKALPAPKRKAEPQPRTEARRETAAPSRKANRQATAQPAERKPAAKVQPQRQQPSKAGKNSPLQRSATPKPSKAEAANPALTDEQKAERRKKKQAVE